MCTIGTSSFASSVLSKSQSTLSITSEKTIGWKCGQCHGTWKEMVHKRIMYAHCPECTPHPTRKSVVTHKPLPGPEKARESNEADISELEQMLNNTHISPPPKSRRQIEDSSFMEAQMSLLDVTKPILTFHRALLKYETENENMDEEVHERNNLKMHYDHKVQEIIPIYAPVPKLVLDLKKYNIISTRLHGILSDNALDVFDRLSEYAFPADDDIAEYRRAYHTKVLECRLKFMMREYSKKEWRKMILPIHHEYEAFEIDVEVATKLGGRVCVWINEMKSDITFDEYMMEYKKIDMVRMECNDELHRLHSRLEHKYGILNEEWRRVDAN